jgi:hypothetical protein
MSRLRARDGQASVELVALLPVLAVLAGALWQGVVAGQAVWLAGTAARSAARAAALGQDAHDAGRAALPGYLRDGVRVRTTGDGGVRVAVAVPLVTGGAWLATVSARARFEPQS